MRRHPVEHFVSGEFSDAVDARGDFSDKRVSRIQLRGTHCCFYGIAVGGAKEFHVEYRAVG